MSKLIDNLAEGYRSHHGSNATLLEWIGVVGVIAFPVLYLLRFTGKLPPLYDDIGFRIAATGLCLFLALRRWWPARLRPYYLGYSYFAVLYCLAFLLPFTLLQNKGATPSVVNMVISAVLIILLTDWRNTIAMLASGYLLSIAVYWITSPAPQLPLEFMIWWIPLCGVLVAGGSISKIVERRAELRRMRLLYSSLAGSIAHEMRNPLTQLRHVLDTVAADLPAAFRAGGNASFTHRQVADMLRAVGQGQDAIVRGLQAITVTLQQLNPTAFDASGFRYLSASRYVEKALNEFAYEDRAHRARVVVLALNDFTFRGDETSFSLILFNLIKNALYYLPTHPSTTVTVTIDGGATNRVVVRDTGPGIPPDRMGRLFAEFQTAGKSGGTGLGLAFCRRAMRAFGGDIKCRSRLGEFTEFTLAFPALPEGELAAHQEAILQRARVLLAAKRILVVDDEPLMRRSTLGKLSTMGCRMDEVGDGRQALDALRKAAYDLVLMDINMPVLDGFAATEQIRQGAVPGRQRTAILGLSSMPASVVARRSKQGGMNGFLGKGCTTLELAEAIAEVLESAALQPAALPATALAGKTILLVEDNAFNRSIIKARLAEWGMQVSEAEHGSEALGMLKAGVRPAAILMDMDMPGLDGPGTTRALRAMTFCSGQDIPVLALTGHSSQERRDAASAAGMNGFLTKPVDPDTLRRELIRVVGNIADAGPLAPAAVATTPLLNTHRIDEFQRLGILEEMLPGCLDQIHRFVSRLEECLAAKDRGGAYQTLHSLLGISGEAGAQALHQMVERFHGVIAEGEWPRESDWLAQIKRLVSMTDKAMLDHYAVRSAPADP